MPWIALQPLADAAAAPPPAPALPLQPSPEATELWAALAWNCLQFTPQVALADGALVLDISASVRLFGGAQAVLRRLYMQNRPLARVQYAQGATSLVALGRLHSHAPLRTAQPVAQLPLHTLAAARPHLALLERLGVRTWGQLRTLPRPGLARRFGQALLDALDRAWGSAPDTYPWLQAPEVFAQRVELAAHVDSAPGLLFAAHRLLELLRQWLRARQCGVLALRLVWELDTSSPPEGPTGQLDLRCAQPTQDIEHLQRLLAEHLARVQLPAPVLYLRLHSLQTAPLGNHSRSLLLHDMRPGEPLQPTLERLVARLGATQVLGVRLCDEHRPERMQHWHTLSPSEHSVATKKIAASQYSASGKGIFGMEKSLSTLWPPMLLAQPQPLPRQRLRLLCGPQRLEGGWWDGAPQLRDYYLAQSPPWGLVWVYRERLHDPALARWWLHGVWG